MKHSHIPLNIRGEIWHMPVYIPTRDDFVKAFPFLTVGMALTLLSAKLYKPVSIENWMFICTAYITISVQLFIRPSSLFFFLLFSIPPMFLLFFSTVDVGRDLTWHPYAPPFPWSQSAKAMQSVLAALPSQPYNYNPKPNKMHWYEMPVRFRGELYILPMCRPVKEDFASMFPYMTAVMAMTLVSAKLYKPVSIGTWARMCVFYIFTATQWYSESSSFALHLPITGPVVLILLCATVGIGRDDAFYSRLPLPWRKSDSESAGDSSQQRPGQSILRAIKSALRRALEFARSDSVEQAATMASYLTFFVELSLFRQYDRYPIMPFKPWIYSFVWHQLVLLPSYLLHAETLSEVLQSLSVHLIHSLPLLSFRCVVTTWHTADTGETSFTLSRLFTTDDTDPTLYY